MNSNNNYSKHHKKHYQIPSAPSEDLVLEEFRAGWERDAKIISEIVQLENELGRPLTMFDLLCRFDRQELDCVSDMLHWLIVEGILYHDEEEAARKEMPR